MRRLRAVAVAAALVGWSFVSPRVPANGRVPVQAAVGAVLVAALRAPLGLTPPRLWAGLRLGSLAGTVAGTAIAASTAVPIVRSSMATHHLPASPATWLAWRIPVGTVWSEEATFRAALGTAAAAAFGPANGRLLQALAFGLSHVPDARAAGEPVAPTVVATGVAGWIFGWLAERCGSLAAPMLTHLAINEAGAVAALAVQRVR
ncbi:CPBP family intramembrane glutamic endopeptidase [Mycobacterium sp. 1423905.2]|uniref:Rv0804 family intramembrane glutamic endopeptidase n=1 Tax=Mycobacterium sp. 1423905.2 TaxID=1856859 RepID=UPI0007FBC5B8|nr:CPBP family intramembrane glutamic endopeptidase [Mycobacterium sp. 1423905.2]OBJ49814.1 abortive phage infection protein [Mycobacterium sp. 1423905.2]